MAALLALAACALLFTWRAVLLGEVFLPLDALMHMHPWRYSYERVPVNNQLTADAIRQIYPRRLLTNEIVSQGAFPLWNPSILSGTPLLDDGQIAFFYPGSLLFLIAPLSYAFGLYAFVHLWLAGVGTFVLARRLGLGHAAGVVAGVAYMLNGNMLNYLQLPELTAGQAVAPWVIWSVYRACEQRHWHGWMLSSVLLALPLLTQLQLALYTYITAGVVVLFFAIRDRRPMLLLSLGVAVGVAIGIAAIQLLPAAALAAQGQRADVGFRTPSGDNLFGLLLRMVLPAIGGFERVGPPPTWGPATIQIPYPYMGLAPLLLAAIGLWRGKHPLGWLWGLIAAAAFAAAARSPIILVLNLLLPPHRQFDDHTRWLMIFSQALAILAAIGVDALLQRRTPDPAPAARWGSRAILLSALLGLGGWSLWFLQPLLPGSQIGIYTTLILQQRILPTLLAAMVVLIGCGLLFVPRWPAMLGVALLVSGLAIDVHWFNSAYNTSAAPAAVAHPTTDLQAGLAAFAGTSQQQQTIYAPTRTIAFLQRQPGPFRIYGMQYEALSPNLAGAFQLEDVRGYHSLYPERYNRLARLIDGKEYGRTTEGMASLRIYLTSADARRRVLDMLNATYFLELPGAKQAERFPGLELAYESDEGQIYRNTQALPRAWLVYRAEVRPNDDDQLDFLADPAFDPAQVAVIDQPIPALSAQPNADPPPQVSYPRPNEVVIQASTQAPALLVLADSYYPGWEAEVDGEPSVVYRANYALRGVYLPAGEHSIHFSYRPKPFLYGAVITCTTLLLLSAGAIAAWYHRRRAQ
jgi:hypothetical protein